MQIYIIRHGETDWNKEKRLQGQQGQDLNEKGVRLAEVTAKALAEVPFDLIITSPLLRAKHTAEIIRNGREIPVVEEERIKEISFGIWEGKHFQDPKEMDVDRFELFHSNTFQYIPPEKGENIRQVISRTGEFFHELINNPEYEEKTILVSTHGCAVRAILNSFYENPLDFWQGGVPGNCAVNILASRNGHAELLQKDVIYYDPSENTPWYSK